MPREIPDAFVRRFGEWCSDRGVKGKYSLIPYPACVGWLDRDLPGWSKQELKASLELVRTLMVPNWDIHPEIVSHTWVIDTKTGRAFPERTSAFMENWGWSEHKSRRSTCRLHELRTPDPQERRDLNATESRRRAGLAIARFPSWHRVLCTLAATSFSARFPTISATFSPASRASPRALNTSRDLTVPTRNASCRSSDARATGSAAGTGSRPAPSTSSSRPT